MVVSMLCLIVNLQRITQKSKRSSESTQTKHLLIESFTALRSFCFVMLFQSILSSALGLLVFAVVTSREAAVVVAAIDCNSLTCTDLGFFKTYKYGDSFVTVDEYDNQVGDLYIPTTPTNTNPNCGFNTWWILV